MRLSHTLSTAAVLALSLIQTRCPPGGGGGGGSTPAPGTISSAFAVTVGPMLLPGPGPTPPGAACPTGSQRLNTLTASGTAGLLMGDESTGRMRVDITVPAGSYTGTVSPIDPLDPTCTRTVGTIPVSGTWTTAHRALVDKGQVPNCVFESNISFSSTIALPLGGPSLASPAQVDSAASATVHFELDRRARDFIDGFRPSSVPLAPGASGRCAGDWKLMTDP